MSNELNWNTKSVLTLACAVFREHGYSNSNTFTVLDTEGMRKWSNKDIVTYTLRPELASESFAVKVKVTQEDVETAEKLTKHFRKLAFDVIKNEENNYTSRVFQILQSETVGMKDFGIVASIPQMYDRDLEQMELSAILKGSVKDFLGKVGDNLTVTVHYLSSRYVPSINCFAYEAITDTNYIVSFLNKNDIAKKGDTQMIKARIKAHGENYHSKTPETKLHYVKVVNRDLEWK